LLGASALHSTSLLRSPRLIACNSRLSHLSICVAGEVLGRAAARSAARLQPSPR
jgi:hypothetical protein